MRKLSLVLTALIATAPAIFAQGGLSGISSGATTNVFTNGVFSGAGTPNDPTTGTDLGATAKFVNNAGVVNLKKCGTSDTMCFKVTKETAGGTTGVLTGNAYVDGAFAEADTCSNACVANNWVKESTTAAGQVMDTGTANTSPCPSGATCLGFAMTAGSGSQTIVRLSPTVGVTAGAGVGGTWVTTRCASGCTGGADTLTAQVAGTAFATTDTHITNALLASGNWVHILAAGTSTTTGAGTSLESYQISINDGTNTLTMTQAAASTHATTLAGLPWKAEGFLFCAGSSQVSVTGAIFSPTNATSTSSSVLSQNDQGIRTLDCTKAWTISIKSNSTMTNSASTTLASLEVDWH